MKTAAALALLATTALTAAAHAQGAVHFDGNSYLFKNGGLNGPPTSYGGSFSAFLDTPSEQSFTIINMAPGSTTNAPGVQISFQQLYGTPGLHLDLVLSSAGGTGLVQREEMVSEEVIPFAGLYPDYPVHISLAWNTAVAPPQAEWSLNGVQGHWDTQFTRYMLSKLTITPTPFAINYDDASTGSPARWFVGAGPAQTMARPLIYIGPLGGPAAFLGATAYKYAGDMAELFLHVGDGDLADLTNSERLGIGEENFAMRDVTGIALPIPMGPGCAQIFGAHGKLPVICMRGDAAHFPLNSALSTPFLVEGTLTTAPPSSDPFNLWRLIP